MPGLNRGSALNPTESRAGSASPRHWLDDAETLSGRAAKAAEAAVEGCGIVRNDTALTLLAHRIGLRNSRCDRSCRDMFRLPLRSRTALFAGRDDRPWWRPIISATGSIQPKGDLFSFPDAAGAGVLRPLGNTEKPFSVWISRWTTAATI
ncbi:hypothetical protein CCGE531_30890 (plasmid) [Rhizobium sp. CCGE531]|nr:hypothetical protein CCGE531_30890 [Rhizobium sp. CCGE531]